MQNLCCENEYKIERLRFTFTANVRFKLRTEFLRIENKQIKQSRKIRGKLGHVVQIHANVNLNLSNSEDNTGRFRLKRVPFSGFRYMKG